MVRRSFVLAGLGSGLLIAQKSANRAARAGGGTAPSWPTGNGHALFSDREEEEEVSPAEDLMREHGVLKRALLVYQEAVARLESGTDLPPSAVPATARLIRDFIENYHERNEEEHLFPRFKKAGKLVRLVDVLDAQHKAGRKVTDRILAISQGAALKDDSRRRELANSIRSFVRMYEPHEAREDTVLFPAFRKLVSGNEYDSLGEEFEKKEHQLFGEDGFEKSVAQVAELEKQLGIFDLSRFTPSV